jgi:hypothetical protein
MIMSDNPHRSPPGPATSHNQIRPQHPQPGRPAPAGLRRKVGETLALSAPACLPCS